MTEEPPQAFRDLKALVRIHLKQILKLDKITNKVPMNAVALLVVIGYEALSKSLHPRKGPEYLFAREHKTLHDVPLCIGSAIFDSLRNGLAHRYDPYPIVVEGVGKVSLELAWKDGAAEHFRGVSVRKVKGHQRFSGFPKHSAAIPRAICLNAESLWQDLDKVFAACEKLLTHDPNAASRFEINVVTNYETFRRAPIGEEAKQWVDFLVKHRMEQT